MLDSNGWGGSSRVVFRLELLQYLDGWAQLVNGGAR